MQPSQTDAEKLHGAMEVIFGAIANNPKVLFFTPCPDGVDCSGMVLLSKVFFMISFHLIFCLQTHRPCIGYFNAIALAKLETILIFFRALVRRKMCLSMFYVAAPNRYALSSLALIGLD